MMLTDGQRVKLVADLRLAGSVTVDGDSGAEPGVVAGFLALASGTEGIVERVDEHEQQPGQAVREYVRLKSLLDDFGHQMPPGSRKQLEEQVGSLEPEWVAHEEHKLRVTVRVRFDNGFVLDAAHEDVFAPV
jgi:hypothetical protein